MDARRSADADVVLKGITKAFGDFVAVDDIDLEVERGEFLALLGPSGCGKTTTLRMIAGFEDPTAGELLLGGESVLGVPPNRRDVNTVFQAYALFPHLCVLDNVAYGLKQRRVGRAERRAKALEALRLVELGDRGDDRPAQLSGGQQQRVALARALVLQPRVLLLDEPLGALDQKLRKQMQIELKRLQGEVGITFVFVTHDQEEAMTMADRIAVMSEGRIEQLGTPAEIYDHPSTPFAARFIGEISELSGVVAGDVAELGGGTRVPLGRRLVELANGSRARLGVRPEAAAASLDGEGTEATVQTAMVIGERLQLVARLRDGQELLIRQRRRSGDAALAGSQPGDAIRLSWEPGAAIVLEEDPGGPAGGREPAAVGAVATAAEPATD